MTLSVRFWPVNAFIDQMKCSVPKNSVNRPNSYLQCQRKDDRITDNFLNRIDKRRHDITRTHKESRKSLTETDKEPTDYKGDKGVYLKPEISYRADIVCSDRKSVTAASSDESRGIRLLNTNKARARASSQGCRRQGGAGVLTGDTAGATFAVFLCEEMI